jgi:hypothetical protein
VEFSGDGYYSVRIFPASVGESRKVKLVFNHTFDDDSAGLATACIPVTIDSSAYYYYDYNTITPYAGYVKAELKSLDGKEYSFVMPGLGKGEFSSKALVLEKTKVSALSAGTISIDDPSGSGEYMWSGIDKDRNATLGFSLMLAESTVTLEPEPETRIIVLDVREKIWNPDEYYNEYYKYYYNGTYSYDPYYAQQTVDVWLRAQKMAITCLQNYVKSSQKFNVVLPGSGNNMVFNSPVAGTIENLLEAGRAVALASVNANSSTEKLLKEAVEQADGGVVILITDLIRPYNYSKIIYDAAGNYTGERVSTDGVEFDSLISRISATVSSSKINLFTIDDEWALWDIAHQSGGFRLATLRDVYYYTYNVEPYYLGGVERYRPSLPRLFIDNPYNSGISGLKVESSDVEDVVFSLDGSGYYWWYGGDIMPMVRDGLLEKSSARAPSLSRLGKMALPRYSMASGMLRVAAVSDRTGSANFKISGKMGGLGFMANVSGSPEDISDIDSSVEWAFRKSEMLAQNDWSANTDSIKQIGKEYHIVTRQTSLLALEPGMELWADTIVPGQNNKSSGDASEDAALLAPGDERGAYSESGMSLDSLSLDDMIEGLTAVQNTGAKAALKVFSAFIKNSELRISIPSKYRSSAVELKLFDLKGRLMVSRIISPADMVTGEIRWNIGAGKSVSASGKYVLKILAAGTEKAFGLPVLK